MNKLRTFVRGGSAFLLVAGAWAALSYGVTDANTSAYVRLLVVAALLPAVPRGLALLKYAVMKRWDARKTTGLSAERGSIFVSDGRVEDAEATLSTLADSIGTEADFDGVSRDHFAEGPGLIVRHAGFHNSFVRVTDDGHLVVTGGSERTHSLASLAERVTSLSLDRESTHPFRQVAPVRGAPRAVLGLLLAVLLLVGLSGVGAAGYPADTYNHSERMVLVGFDVRSDAVPSYSETDATLGKATFLVGALGEEAVEISWDRNETSRLERHATQAVQLSAVVSDMLSDARETGLTAEQSDRASRIESDLHDAECRVAGAIGERVESGSVESDTTDLQRLRDRLRSNAAAANAACSA